MNAAVQVYYPGVYSVEAHVAAIDAALPRFTADGRWRIAYTLPSGEDVRVSPHPGAVKMTGWLFPLGGGPKLYPVKRRHTRRKGV